MTTAHRPTWKAAVGRASEGGFGGPSSAQSVLDVAAHTKMKVRTGHQLVADRKAALRASLLKLKEAEAKAETTTVHKREVVPAIEAEGRRRLLRHTTDVDDAAVRAKYDDGDEHGDDDDSDGPPTDDSDLDASDSDASESDDDSEDEEAALQAELAKIRAEREDRARAEAAAEEESRMEEAALSGNPLLGGSGFGGASGRLKRRWNDDVVFRNQARDEPDRNTRRFINDTVRNDFHKRFLNKFIK